MVSPPHFVGMKLTDRHRLETVHEQCGTSPQELVVSKTRASVDTFCEWMKTACRTVSLLLVGKNFLGCTALQTGDAMRKARRFQQRRRNVPCAGRPDGTRLKTCFPESLKAPTGWTFDAVKRSPWRECCATLSSVPTGSWEVLVVKKITSTKKKKERVLGALCCDFDLAAEDVEIASGEASVTTVWCVWCEWGACAYVRVCMRGVVWR
eukprot:350306-Chlamydomonas_euryale.AAC.9